jgi:pseudaminic acid cytidylyltransferase
MRIAVFPARGGSKRIPHKNTREFCGKPIIAWPIEAAQASGLFSHILVSTDDPDVATLSRALGVTVPFVRPAELSGDHVATIPVIAHATAWALAQGWPLAAVCCVYPAAPMLCPGDLRSGVDALDSGDWDYAFSAVELDRRMYRAFRLHPEGGIESLFPQFQSTRSQDLPGALVDAGQFYWGRPSAWIEGRAIFGRRSRAVVLPAARVHDIDDDDDWRLAEEAFQALRRMRP